MNDLELEITSNAYNDIEISSDYIVKDNKTAATKFVKLFYKAAKKYIYSFSIIKLFICKVLNYVY